MKILIQNKAHTLRLVVPTNLVFRAFLLKLGRKCIRMEGIELGGLSEDAIGKVCAQIRHVRKVHGAWELVEIRRGEELVKVIL